MSDGEKTRAAIAAQPEWLARVPTDWRLLPGNGCSPPTGTASALEAIGAPVTLVPTRHPVVDIVPFQLLTVDLAADRGVDPDPIRGDDPRWERARKAYA